MNGTAAISAERAVAEALVPELVLVAAATAHLIDRVEHYLRAEDRHAAGTVGIRYFRKAESELKTAIGLARQANLNWEKTK